jgi:hypothetical protein
VRVGNESEDVAVRYDYRLSAMSIPSAGIVDIAADIVRWTRQADRITYLTRPATLKESRIMNEVTRP